MKTYRFFIASVDGRKRFENASVDADICIRFRWIKNGGITTTDKCGRSLKLNLIANAQVILRWEMFPIS